MNPDVLDRFAADLRRAAPPAPRADLRDDILKLYDANTVALRASARPRAARIAMAAAAVALLAISVFLVMDRNGAPPIASTTDVAHSGAPALNVEQLILQERIQALRAVLAQPVPTRTVRAPEPAVVHSSAPPNAARQNEKQLRTIQSMATLTSQPVEPLYRLVSARLFERVDKDMAVARYRELLKEYPEGPACAVARERLRELNP